MESGIFRENNIGMDKWKTIESWDVETFLPKSTLEGRGFFGHNSIEHNNNSSCNQ